MTVSEKKVSQRGLGSHRLHGTTAGLTFHLHGHRVMTFHSMFHMVPGPLWSLVVMLYIE